MNKRKSTRHTLLLGCSTALLGDDELGEPTKQEPRPRPLWHRVKELQQTSWPSDDKEAEVLRAQAIEILNDSFSLLAGLLGEAETRILFDGTAQRVAPRRAHRPTNKAYKMRCLETFDVIKAQGIPESKIAAIIDAAMREYRNTIPGTIARDVRRFVKARRTRT